MQNEMEVTHSRQHDVFHHGSVNADILTVKVTPFLRQFVIEK